MRTKALILLFLATAASGAAPAAAQRTGSFEPRPERFEQPDMSIGVRARRSPRAAEAPPEPRASIAPAGDDGPMAEPIAGRRESGIGPGPMADSPLRTEVSPRPIEAGDAVRRWRQDDDGVANWRRAERYRGDSPAAVQERNLSGSETAADTASGSSIVERNLRRVGEPRPLSRLGRRVVVPPIDETGATGSSRSLPPVLAIPSKEERIARSTATSVGHRWRDDWRRDGRYDWRRHRDRNRSLFRLGFYFDPYGWSYRRHGIGWHVWPSYYGPDYWLRNPWTYRLPYAPAGHRWIRYHRDALLVDLWDGRVVDVIYNFFW